MRTTRALSPELQTTGAKNCLSVFTRSGIEIAAACAQWSTEPKFLPKLVFAVSGSSGSPGRIRTSDQPVNSRLLYH